ncbi:hypothetical protein Hdeb2414_s0008g00266261 [Helianthus debilis subsp. tardiflorus]
MRSHRLQNLTTRNPKEVSRVYEHYGSQPAPLRTSNINIATYRCSIENWLLRVMRHSLYLKR